MKASRAQCEQHLWVCTADRLLLQVDRFGIYKVETIGDAYMAVAGESQRLAACPGLP